MTFSDRIVTRLLREEMGFNGLVFTDSMRMRAISDLATPSRAATRAVLAGHDVILHSPDNRLTFRGLRDAVQRGVLTESRVDQSVRRVLVAKARIGLHRDRAVSLANLPLIVGTREHKAVARHISERSLTLISDDMNHLPLPIPRTGSILYLSVLDYPSGWGLGAPSGTLIPELEARWSNVTAIELSDRTSLSEIELVQKTASRYDAVIAGVFVRTASFSGRMDLSNTLVDFLRHLGRDARSAGQPFITVFFGNPYAATFLMELPTILLTYDFYDLAEASVARALAGEVAVSGRLPVALGGRFLAGHGLTRVPAP